MIPPAELLYELLDSQPGSDKRGLVRLLRGRGHQATAHEVNNGLYSYPARFRWSRDGEYRRIWFVIAATAQRPLAPSQIKTANVADTLYPWQRRALEAYRLAGGIGVVEAVTGAGKTRLALAAAELELAEGGKVVVLVHTLALVDQWQSEVEKHVTLRGRAVHVGRLGGGRTDGLETCDVLIATVQMGHRERLLPPPFEGLLIADECHHYGAVEWQAALEERFRHRLGLTATYEREDGGIEEFLNPYFGQVLYSVMYEEALADDVIARFKVAFVGVPFTSSETEQYEQAASWASKSRKRLIDYYGVTAEPFATFIKEVNQLKKAAAGEASKQAGWYLSAFNKRRSVLSNAVGKLERLKQLAQAVASADRTILFTQTMSASRAAVDELANEGISGEVLNATMDLSERRKVFSAFEDGVHELVAAPKLLDEGIDVPSADLAILLASSKSKRQMIQRMGRVIRKKADGRLARIVILFVEATR